MKLKVIRDVLTKITKKYTKSLCIFLVNFHKLNFKSRKVGMMLFVVRTRKHFLTTLYNIYIKQKFKQ